MLALDTSRSQGQYRRRVRRSGGDHTLFPRSTARQRDHRWILLSHSDFGRRDALGISGISHSVRRGDALRQLFFLPPIGRFTIADPQDWVALLTFLPAALVVSHVSDRAKRQNLEVKPRQQDTEQLYALSHTILLTDAAAEVLFDSKANQYFHGGPAVMGGAGAVLKQSVLQSTPQLGQYDVWPILPGGQAIGALCHSRTRTP